MRPVEVWMVSFDFRRAFRRLVEVWRVRFVNKNAFLMLEEVLRTSKRTLRTSTCLLHALQKSNRTIQTSTMYILSTRSDRTLGTSSGLVQALRKSKRSIQACMTIVEAPTVRFHNRNACMRLEEKFGESFLAAAVRVGGGEAKFTPIHVDDVIIVNFY